MTCPTRRRDKAGWVVATCTLEHEHLGDHADTHAGHVWPYTTTH